MFSMFGRPGAPTEGGPQVTEATFSGLQRPFYSALKSYLVQYMRHSLAWGSVLRNLKLTTLRAVVTLNSLYVFVH